MNEWQYEPVPDLDQTMAERLRNFPREPDMTVFALRALAALLIRGWLKLYHRLGVIGLENLPTAGSFVMVANHTSHLDAISLSAALPLKKLHRAFPAAAADYFFTSVPRAWFSAVVVNALPFDRKVHKRQSLKICQELLANPDGNVLIIFPEGTRSTTGKLSAFKPGIGMLLAGQNIPVVPCYLDGAFRAWGKGKAFPKPHKLRLTIGQRKNYATLEPGKEAALRICRELYDEVTALATSSP